MHLDMPPRSTRSLSLHHHQVMEGEEAETKEEAEAETETPNSNRQVVEEGEEEEVVEAVEAKERPPLTFRTIHRALQHQSSLSGATREGNSVSGISDSHPSDATEMWASSAEQLT